MCRSQRYVLLGPTATSIAVWPARHPIMGRPTFPRLQAFGYRAASRRFPSLGLPPSGTYREGELPRLPAAPWPPPQGVAGLPGSPAGKNGRLKTQQSGRVAEHKRKPVFGVPPKDHTAFPCRLPSGRLEQPEEPAPQPEVLPSFLRRQHFQDLFGNLLSKA